MTQKRTVIPAYKIVCNSFDDLIEVEFYVPDNSDRPDGQVIAIRLDATQSRGLVDELSQLVNQK
ncbi:hypothetical protein B6I52_02110 [Klebsiella pneumoniae]|nr:hypothetical protein B6I52_02110 [Klebsiella pneumoniae]